MKPRQRAINAISGNKVERDLLYGDIIDYKAISKNPNQDLGQCRKDYTKICMDLNIDMTKGYSACYRVSRYDKSVLKKIQDKSEILKYLKAIDFQNEQSDLLNTVCKDIEIAGDELLILPQIKWSIFSDLSEAIGFNEFVTSSYTHDPLTLELICEMTRLVIRDIEMLSEIENIPVILYMDDIAYDGGLLYHPETINNYFSPSLNEIIRTAKNHNLKLIFHSHGDVRTIIHKIANSGIDGFLPLDNRWFNILQHFVQEDFLIVRGSEFFDFDFFG
jgi:hypothetical protein